MASLTFRSSDLSFSLSIEGPLVISSLEVLEHKCSTIWLEGPWRGLGKQT